MNSSTRWCKRSLSDQSSVRSNPFIKINSIKTNLPFFLVILCLTFASSESYAQEEKSETLSGFVEAVDGNNISVNHRRQSKVFTINGQTKIHYVGFLDAAEEIKPGFVIRGGVDSRGLCHSLWVTLPIPEGNLKPSAEMLTMTPAELHKMADSNGDGELSYVEYATSINRSHKHGAVGFSKSDKDNSGTLNLAEFEPKLTGLKWYRLSRKTGAEWHAEFDADSDGVLSKNELANLLGSEAHIDTFFKRADKNKSGDLDIPELSLFLESLISPSVKKKKAVDE